MNFKNLNVNDIEFNNIFNLISKDWMLISSGNSKSFNTMTASWGGLGHLWNKNVAFCFVRPQRYTFEFMEKNEYFSLSFFEDKYKKDLVFCGRNSGRNVNKMKKTNLTPNFENNAPCFKESSIILVCKKIYSQFIKSDSMIDKSIEDNYKEKDYHKMYIGEITECLVKI